MDRFCKEAALIFKAVGDENRVGILIRLTAGEYSAGALLESLEISQPTLSHHMKLLCQSGLVEQRKIGRTVYYSLSADGTRRARKLLKTITKLKSDKNI